MLITDNGLAFETTGDSQLFDSLVTKTVNQDNLQATYDDTKSALMFKEENLISPAQTFSSQMPGGSLAERGEREKAKERSFTFGGKKGIYQKKYNEKVTMSEDFVLWAKATNSIEGASETIQGEILTGKKATTELVKASYKSRAIVMAKVLVDGLSGSVTAYEGPGSMCIDSGEPLFSASHPLPIVGAGVTQSNLITGAFTDKATRLEKLEAGLDLLRGMKFYTGPRVATNKGTPYKLMVSSDEYGRWINALNNYEKTSGVGENANTTTYFIGEYRVIVEVMPYLNDYDPTVGQIGTQYMPFLINPTYIKETEALKCYSLGKRTSGGKTSTGVAVSNFSENDPVTFVTNVTDRFGADHYGAELGIVGFTGA